MGIQVLTKKVSQKILFFMMGFQEQLQVIEAIYT
jgi:hypothetical protein